MSLKNKVVIGLSAGALALGVLQALEPKTLEQTQKDRQQQQLEDLADADEQSKDRIRDKGNDALNAELDSKNIPGQHPPKPPKLPKLPFIP